jgi:hypothetical protein
MTGTPPGDNTLTLRIFRALYRDFDLHTIGGAHVAVPEVLHASPRTASATSPARSAATNIKTRAHRRPGAEPVDGITRPAVELVPADHPEPKLPRQYPLLPSVPP